MRIKVNTPKPLPGAVVHDDTEPNWSKMDLQVEKIFIYIIAPIDDTKTPMEWIEN